MSLAKLSVTLLLILARPVTAGMGDLDLTPWYIPKYPVCIMEGPECEYWLKEPGGEIKKVYTTKMWQYNSGDF